MRVAERVADEKWYDVVKTAVAEKMAKRVDISIAWGGMQGGLIEGGSVACAFASIFVFSVFIREGVVKYLHEETF